MAKGAIRFSLVRPVFLSQFPGKNQYAPELRKASRKRLAFALRNHRNLRRGTAICFPFPPVAESTALEADAFRHASLSGRADYLYHLLSIFRDILYLTHAVGLHLTPRILPSSSVIGQTRLSTGELPQYFLPELNCTAYTVLWGAVDKSAPYFSACFPRRNDYLQLSAAIQILI